VEFPVGASVPDLLEWFWVEVTAMPIAFTDCNENITCHVLIGIFKMFVGKGCGPRPDSENACEELVDQTRSTILYAED
jgi:hypothetical protein